MEAMNDPALIAEVAQAVRSVARIPAEVAVTGDSLLVDDLAIDSLDLVGVVLEIQDHFGVVIDDEDVPSLRRVSDLAAQVAARRGAAAA
jgi:acyl carrier protein